MILTCPACETQYYTEEARIPVEGREVRCPACRHAWTVYPEGSEAGAAGAKAAHERYLEARSLRQRRRNRMAATLVWSVTGGLFVSALAGAILMRNEVVRVWPESASLFQRAGLEVNRFGVEFADVERMRELQGTKPVLTVRGVVRNSGRVARTAPAVRIGLRDDFGREVAVLHAKVAPATLSPGETGRFEAVMDNPPPESYALDLRFVPKNAMPAPRTPAGDTAEAGTG